MNYVILSAPSGSGLRGAVGKLSQSADDIKIVDIEDILCSLPSTENALNNAGVTPPTDGPRTFEMYDITWNLSRFQIIELWEEATTNALHQLSRSTENLKILSCHMLYFCGKREEYYSPINPSNLKNSRYTPSHILLLIDDVYDMYLRLAREGALFDPKTRIPALKGRIKEEEGVDLNKLNADRLKSICSEWQLGVMANLLYWRNLEIIIAEQLALQFRSNFLVWGTKQLTDVPILWMQSESPVTIYLSHPISRPRRMHRKTGRWPEVVSRFNGLQSGLLQYDVSCVMPSAIDEYRIKRSERRNNTKRRIPFLETRWPLPGDINSILYSFPSPLRSADHRKILSYKKWNFKRKEFVSVSSCSTETSEAIDAYLRGFERHVEHQVSSRDHMFVSWTDGILVFRPLFSDPVWSSGVRAEIKHWALIARSDVKKRILFVHFYRDVLDLIEYYNSDPGRKMSLEKEIEDELITIISTDFNLDERTSSDVLKHIKRGAPGELLDQCPISPNVASDIQEEFIASENKAKKRWLEKKLIGYEISIGEVNKDQVEYYVVRDFRSLKEKYVEICVFFKTGDKQADNTSFLNRLIRRI